jgi:hypothetical protein
MAKKFWSSSWDSKVTQSGYEYSSYWLNNMKNVSYRSMFDDDTTKRSGYDIFRLIELRQAVSNFVRILTQRHDIGVVFAEKGETNATNGKTIVISPDLDGDKFDVAVGLALHEASHILYTDFEQLSKRITSASVKPEVVGHRNWRHLQFVWNVVEDFFIDSVTYTSSPGYRGYYQALYNEYFNSKDIIKGLRSKKYCDVNWNSYLFHLCNIRNPQRNLSALPKLDEIFNELDLENISRLKKPAHRFDLAFKLYDVIDSVLDSHDDQSSKTKEDEKSEGGNADGIGDADDINDDSSDSMGDESTDDGESPDGGDESTDDGESPDGGDESETEYETMSKSMETRLGKLFQKQLAFYSGNPQKKTISKKDASSINSIKEMDAEVRNVDYSQRIYNIGEVTDKVRVIVVKNVTLELIERDSLSRYGIHSLKKIYQTQFNRNVQQINTAITNGRLLARKLQLRNEERVTKTTRLKEGKIDRRLIHEIGFDNYQIFNKINIKTYKPVHIHVSIDQSGSMSGERFEKSMQLAAMFATAATMLKNVHVCVTLRGQSGYDPHIAYIFDSRKHGIQQITNVFTNCYATGSTPESLTFAAIEKEIKKDALNAESYFINICDGEPTCSYRSQNGTRLRSYSGHYARKHCKDQMKRMEKYGIKFMAYFLTEDSGYSSYYASYGMNNIRECYEDRVIKINGIHEITTIAKTMNAKLLDDIYS